jgi:glyoxylase-like metal-dependent hydrolase (beta-lactamase superfamily II)
MTLDGTNTYVLKGRDGLVVVDPGPLDEQHLRRVAGHGEVRRTLLTHGHPDHAEGARRFAELTGSPVLARDPAHCVGADEPLGEDGESAGVAGLLVDVLHTPGHTADSVCFVVTGGAGPRVVLTGDTVLGRGTTVVAHPDGELAAYLASLERIAALTGGGAVTTILPGHGPVVPDASAMVEFYRVHRRERLEQVRQALADGAQGVEDVVERVYAAVPREVWPAARLSVAAQLEYLEKVG